MKRAIVFAAILMCAHVCLATTINVPADQPTISAGIDAAVDGDTVLVAPGEYYDGILIYYRSIYLLSSGGPSVTVLYNSASYGPLINLFGASSQVSGFTLDGSCCGFSWAAIIVNNFAEAVISKNVFRGFHTDYEVIQIWPGRVVVDHNLFLSNGGTACIGVYMGSQVTITNNTMVGNNAGMRLDLGNLSHVRNNIICSSKGAGLMTESPEPCDCNVLWNNHPDYADGLVPSPHDFSSNPLYCDTTSGDFHLQSNSPCAPANNSCGALIGALPVACGWNCGDIDGSGDVNLADAVRLIYYLFVNGSEPLDLSGGDVNQDGRLNIADIVYLINYVFVGGPAPCATGE